MMNGSPCRLYEAGTWRMARQVGGQGLCFSADSRLMVVRDASKALRLVETETGRTLANLESPDQCIALCATFSPDGSRLVVTTSDGPAVHIWDLRAIRRRLAESGLDWDAASYSDDDPARADLPPLSPIPVDFGPLAGHIELMTERANVLVDRYTARLNEDPNDAEAYHLRAHSQAALERFREAFADLAQAMRLRPQDAHLRDFRGSLHSHLSQHEAAIVDLETALRLRPDQPPVRELLAQCYNNRAWELATGPIVIRDVERAQVLIQQAVGLDPGKQVSLNTQGVVQYRAGRHADAVTTLERSLAAGRGQYEAFDLVFMAMAHRMLGQLDEARDCYDRAVRWMQNQHNLDARASRELAGFVREAKVMLTDLPENVFSRPQ
jgi:tetratricopeptide (TPR) repeat protein